MNLGERSTEVLGLNHARRDCGITSREGPGRVPAYMTRPPAQLRVDAQRGSRRSDPGLGLENQRDCAVAPLGPNRANRYAATGYLRTHKIGCAPARS